MCHAKFTQNCKSEIGNELLLQFAALIGVRLQRFYFFILLPPNLLLPYHLSVAF